ncbi:TAXI family TRAP transporter solute-binding subunit [Rhodoblastus sp.]|uniref:TAXI family TRAP transporter solute-binding subunit n=1 Tax=Rhodoblastus sp. TaxID=1962975 RepID=UPI0035B3B9C4
MFGAFGKPRTLALLVSIAFLVAAAALGAIYIFQPKATIRITTGPEGGQARRFIEAFIKVAEKQHPRVHFEQVTVPDLASSAKALEDHKVDLALIRSDAPLPINGETLVILRHDAVAIVVPNKSAISSPADLSGKIIAIPVGPAQNDNSHALDLILNYYGMQPQAVKREFLAIDDIGPAIERKRVAAAVAVGPVGPGDVVDTVASIARATRNTPKILAFDDADAIVKRFPMFESYDVPQGGFKAKPKVPDDTMTTLAVNYRFVVPITMLDIVANAIGRSILATKAQLTNIAPTAAAQIEAPDVSDTNPLLPIHPGFAAFLNNGDQSFFDQAQSFLYIFGIPLSVGASLVTLLFSTLAARRAKKDRAATQRLLSIAQEAATAEGERLEALEKEFHKAVADCLGGADDEKADQWKTSMAIQHALRRFERHGEAAKSGSA